MGKTLRFRERFLKSFLYSFKNINPSFNEKNLFFRSHRWHCDQFQQTVRHILSRKVFLRSKVDSVIQKLHPTLLIEPFGLEVFRLAS